MTTIAPVVPSIFDPSPRKWTKAEYYQLAELGMFQGQRAELIEGEIMVMSPQKFSHFATLDRSCDVLRAAFGSGYWTRSQGPLDFGLPSEPEPDVSVVRGRRDDYSAHPLAADTVLIVEVSDTTLAFDRGNKASLYARAGIADYWVIDLVHTQLEVRRSPVADASARYGFRFADLLTFGPGQSVPLLSLPSAIITVSSLLG